MSNVPAFPPIDARVERLRAALSGTRKEAELLDELVPDYVLRRIHESARPGWNQWDDDFDDDDKAPSDTPGTCIILQPTTFCNINCRYCYLPRRSQALRMSPKVLQQAFNVTLASPLIAGPVTFVWHLGEPLSVPPSFYEEAFALANNTAGRFARIAPRHVFQTNATLINKEWLDLISRHEVSVGVSIDGPDFIHDSARVKRNGAGSHRAAMRGISQLKEAGIRFRTISVVTDFTLDYAEDFYDFFASNNFGIIGFNIDEIEGANLTSSFASADVNVQVLGLAAAVRDRRLRFGGRRGVAVVAERGFGDDPGL